MLLILAASLGLSAVLSDNLGEQHSAPEVFLRSKSSNLELQVDYSPSDKVESNAGWLAGFTSDYKTHNLIAGLSYRYRDGGLWHKHTVWARTGYELITSEGIAARIILDSALSSRDRQSSISSRLTLPLTEHLAIENILRLMLYDQGREVSNRQLGTLVHFTLVIGW